jgi:hypothetical protein
MPVPLPVFLAEGIIDWLCLALVLFALGKMLSRTSFRAIDVFGTQAMARWPTLIVAFGALAPPYQRLLAYVTQQLMGVPARPPIGDIVAGGAVMLLGLLATVLTVALMYQAYSICCNLRGGRAIGSFIAGLIIAEVISKIAILRLLAL